MSRGPGKIEVEIVDILRDAPGEQMSSEALLTGLLKDHARTNVNRALRSLASKREVEVRREGRSRTIRFSGDDQFREFLANLDLSYLDDSPDPKMRSDWNEDPDEDEEKSPARLMREDLAGDQEMEREKRESERTLAELDKIPPEAFEMLTELDARSKNLIGEGEPLWAKISNDRTP